MQPTAAEIEAYKVTVSVPVDISKLPPPVPEGKQDPNFFCCTMCDKRFKQKRHQKTHIEEYCSYLMEKVKIQCPHGECGNLFTHVKNFRDHLSSKHGAEEQYQCIKCGRKFHYQKSYSWHIANCEQFTYFSWINHRTEQKIKNLQNRNKLRFQYTKLLRSYRVFNRTFK